MRRLASPHTARNVKAVVVEVLGEWKIPKEKISAVLTDIGSNVIKAFKEWLDVLHAASDNYGDEEA